MPVPKQPSEVTDAEMVERMAGAMRDVLAFLQNPEWGTTRYMEGVDVYHDRQNAIIELELVLGFEAERRGTNAA